MAGFWDNLVSGTQKRFDSFSADPIAGLSSLGSWLSTPIGSGENASSPLQLGVAGLGLLQQQRAFEDQLEEARRQFNFQKGVTQGNFLNQGANFLNQGLFQLESLNAFNPKRLNAASRTVAKASINKSSKVSPFCRRSLKRSV